MVRLTNWVLLGAFGGALIASIGAAGCRSVTIIEGSPGAGGGENASSSSSSSSNGAGGTAAGSGGGGGGAVGAGGSGGAGGVVAPLCDGKDATVYDVTLDPNAANPVGPGTKVKLKGVVAMSQKFLASKSSVSDKCLWGVFISAPDVVGKETAPYSGTLVLSYGDNATKDPASGNTYCPKLGGAPGDPPPNDAIPDDTAPGDILNVTGKTDSFLLPTCAQQAGGATVGQRQIADVCLVEKVGTGAVPAAHALSAAEVTALASPTDQLFHDMWGGVKVQVNGPTATVPQIVNGMASVVNAFGKLYLEGSNLQVDDKLYYRAYLKATNKCHDGPKLTPPYTSESVSGFSYLDYCTWGLSPNNKCTDLTPASEDCAAGGPGGAPLTCP